MLSFHLDQASDRASRRFETIDRMVNWIDSQVNLAEKSVCDLGCGPGLYTQRFFGKGASVTGVDVSAHSLQYAKSDAVRQNLSIRYISANYLTDDLPSGFDLVTLIYTDLCVLSPEQRATFLSRMRKMLNPGGQIVIDVAGMGLFNKKQELTLIENQLMNGFWSEDEYVGIQCSFLYPHINLSLDRYMIVEPNESWEIFNWLQHFTPKSIEHELSRAGFAVDQMTAGLSGESLVEESDYIAVIASRESK